MSSIALLIVGLAAFITGYMIYSRFVAEKIYRLDPDFVTPAHEFEDGVDFVPTNRHILFGHHFTSVAGAAPIVGPAIAVIWGWFPALVWVVLGACLVGCVHDFSALVLSVRSKGLSVGQVAESLLGPRGRTLFHFIIFVKIIFLIFIIKIFSCFTNILHPTLSCQIFTFLCKFNCSIFIFF